MLSPVIIALLLISALVMLFLYVIKELIIIVGGTIYFLFQNNKKDNSGEVENQEHKNLEIYRVDSDEYQDETIESDSFDSSDAITEDNFLDYSIEERMELLDVDTYTQMCKEYPEFVTYDEFQNLLDNDMIRSVDNTIEFKGMFFHNENSEDTEWRRFKRFRNNYNERYGDESSYQNLDEFPHDYYQEQLSDLEDMEHYGSDMSPEEISDAYNDVLDEYASELEEYNNRKNKY